MQREVEEKLDDHLLNYNLFGFFDHFFKLKREVLLVNYLFRYRSLSTVFGIQGFILLIAISDQYYH